MDFNFNIYSLFLIFFGFITIVLSCYIYTKESGAVRFFGLMMFCNALWSLGYGFEIASPTLEQALLFNNIEYIGIACMPINWLLFCLKLAGKNAWYKKPLNIGILLVVSAFTLLLVWTNKYHHLYFTSYQMDYSGAFPLVNLQMGPFYWFFTCYFYILIAYGCYLLLAKFKKSDSIYRAQNYSIVVAACIPLLANIAYIIDIRPFGNMDITPFAFIASIVLITLGIYRFRLFDMVPIAREKVLELIQDGFVVLDKKKRVIDHNVAFLTYLPNHQDEKIIGRQIDLLFQGQKVLSDFLEQHQSGKIELNLNHDNKPMDVEADVRYLDTYQIDDETIIIKFQNLSPFKEEALKTKIQAVELHRLNQLKDRIFSIISHDLRGPLVNLSEVLKMISNEEMSAEEFKLLSPTLNKDIIYTTDLLENILHWSRSQLEGYGIKKEFFDLKAVVVNEVSYHGTAASTKKIEIIQDVFPGALVYADLLMIQIVIRNILSNAIKFCHENCVIQLTSVFKGEFMQLRIQDNGIGISEEMIGKLFTSENYSTRGTMNEKGTGLGLLVCKEFMERNSGRLSVESKPGQGSIFYIDIPVA